MKSRTYTLLTAVVAFGALTVPAQTPGQGLHYYKVVQLNTFGGPNSYFTFSNRSLNNAGVATGFSDTSVSVSPPYCFNDCFLEHTFLWKDGALTDLGGLPGVAISGSGPNYINAKGVIAGIAFNGGPSGRTPLLRPSPLRTVRKAFAVYGSSPSIAFLRKTRFRDCA